MKTISSRIRLSGEPIIVSEEELKTLMTNLSEFPNCSLLYLLHRWKNIERAAIIDTERIPCFISISPNDALAAQEILVEYNLLQEVK